MELKITNTTNRMETVDSPISIAADVKYIDGVLSSIESGVVTIDNVQVAWFTRHLNGNFNINYNTTVDYTSVIEAIEEYTNSVQQWSLTVN